MREPVYSFGALLGRVGLLVVVGALLGACDPGLTEGNTCAKHATEETGGEICIVTFEQCDNGLFYEVACVRDLTIDCVCRRSGAAVGQFVSETLCPWTDRVNAGCTWDLRD